MKLSDMLKYRVMTTQRVEGYDEGYSKGYQAGSEAGKQEERSAFWGLYQANGTRENYDGAFYGEGWGNDLFTPMYDIRPSRAMRMFSMARISGDLAALLEGRGVTLDTSEARYLTEMFSNATMLTRIPRLDLRSAEADYMSNVFANCYELHTIDGIVFKENFRCDGPFFYQCSSLVNLTIEGTLFGNGVNLSWSPLSKASIVSVVNALSDTATGNTATLRLSAVNAAFETSAGAADGSTSAEWLALKATKPNWTISLINS